MHCCKTGWDEEVLKKIVQTDTTLLEGDRAMNIKSSSKVLIEHVLEHTKETTGHDKDSSHANSFIFIKEMIFYLS